MSGEMIQRFSVEAMVASRDHAIDALASAAKLLDAAVVSASEWRVHLPSFSDSGQNLRLSARHPTDMDRFRRAVDVAYWTAFVSDLVLVPWRHIVNDRLRAE